MTLLLGDVALDQFDHMAAEPTHGGLPLMQQLKLARS